MFPRVDLNDVSTRSLPRSSRALSGSARPLGSFAGSIQATNETFASTVAVQASVPTKSDPEAAFCAWPKPLEYAGIDLGGWFIKMHRVSKTVAKAPGIRSFATVTLEGDVVVGNVDDAMDNPERTVYDLTAALGENAEAAFTATAGSLGHRSERHHVAHLLACALRQCLGSRPAVLGVCIPPQLADGLGMKLYSIAAAANISRFFAFNQTAALCKSYLHRGASSSSGHVDAASRSKSTSLAVPGAANSRRSRGGGAKPDAILIVDCGASGSSIAVCVPQGEAIECIREFFSHVGGASVMQRACDALKREHPEASAVELHEGVCALLREYCDMEEYQLQNGQAAEAAWRCYQAPGRSGRVTARMGRSQFTTWFADVCAELSKLADSAAAFTSDRTQLSSPHLSEASRPRVDVIFNGKPFGIPELRAHCLERLSPFNVEQVYPPDFFSVSEGAALLASEMEPGVRVGRTDVSPLFLNPAVSTEVFHAMRPGQTFTRRASEALGLALRGSTNRFLSAGGSGTASGGGTQSNFRRHSSLVP